MAAPGSSAYCFRNSQLWRDRFDVAGAGTKPGVVRPEAIAAIRELGIAIASHRSKYVAEFNGQQYGDVITVCDSAKESCPLYLGATKRLQERMAIFRRVRDELRMHLAEFARQQSSKGFER